MAFAIAAAIVVGSSVRVGGAGVVTICGTCCSAAAAAIASLSSADGGAPATCPVESAGVSVADVFYKYKKHEHVLQNGKYKH